MVRNDIRRTRIKLKILEETPNIDWVLHDLIDEVDMLINGNTSAKNHERLLIINDLKMKYKMVLRQVPPDPSILKLDI